MTAAAWAQFLALVALLTVSAPPLGRYMAAVFSDARRAPGDRFFRPFERAVYRVCRVDEEQEQPWTVYARSLLAAGLVGVLAVHALQRLQGWLPGNPNGLPGPPPHLAWNTAVSFVTNTDWQSYAGESTMSHLTQMAALTTQNFVSAAAGMAVMAAFVRGLARRRATTVGNFWVDATRATTRVLLPLSVVFTLVLVSQGVVQNLSGDREVTTVEGAGQVIPGGPVASQVAIKQLGTNGGGFFNANSAHPFENGGPFNNLVETYLIAIIPFALAFTFGHMVADRRQGRAVFAIMLVIWAAVSLGTMALETRGNPLLDTLGVDQEPAATQPGGNMEGKEVRFGPAASALWAATTTGTSNGSVNSMHDSYTPLGGMLPLVHMMLGEVSPGGVGVGLNGLLVLVLLSVFVAGLMVGRTPEYLGKKIQAAEMKLVVCYLLVVPTVLLGFAATSLLVGSVRDVTVSAPGPHGLTQILYAFTSAANNNGSAFAGITAAPPWMDTTLGLAMLVGRFFLIVPVLAIAGSLARKERVPETAGTLPTHTPLFGGLVIGVTVVVAGLTYFPALALGPVAEHLGT